MTRNGFNQRKLIIYLFHVIPKLNIVCGPGVRPVWARCESSVSPVSVRYAGKGRWQDALYKITYTNYIHIYNFYEGKKLNPPTKAKSTIQPYTISTSISAEFPFRSVTQNFCKHHNVQLFLETAILFHCSLQ